MSFELDPVKYGILWNTTENNQKKLEELNRKMDKMESKLEELVALANRSQGGLWAGMAIVSAISGVVGFIGSYLSSK
jgi:hypothetical protein